MESLRNGAGFMEISSRKKNCGRKMKDYDQQIASISTVPLAQRSTLASTAQAINVPKTVLFRRLKAGVIISHTNSIKPFLTDENKAARVRFCRQHANLDQQLFETMLDTVHIDEKWFYLTKPTMKCYLGADEELPQRSCKSKRFVTKVMFLCAVARPRWDTTRNALFDGKIGIWPFTVKEEAQRSSRNRPRGSLVTKPLNVTTEVYREFILDKVLPAIEEKWPRCHRGMAIKIQQDNARPHISGNDPAFLERVAAMELNVSLIQQPPNSPDLNVLDLGYFNAIQSLQQKQRMNNIDELVDVVENSFAGLHQKTLNKVFLTLQKVMELVILNDGCNQYKLPHLKKDALLRQGTLPVSLPVTAELREKIESLEAVDEAVEAVVEAVEEARMEVVVEAGAAVVEATTGGESMALV